MDHDTDGDGAINLSTSQRPSVATTPNGDTPAYGQDQQDNDQVGNYDTDIAIRLQRPCNYTEFASAFERGNSY